MRIWDFMYNNFRISDLDAFICGRLHLCDHPLKMGPYPNDLTQIFGLDCCRQDLRVVARLPLQRAWRCIFHARGLEARPLECDIKARADPTHPRDAKGELNFEDPGSLRIEKIKEDLEALLDGKAVELPKFCFKTGTIQEKTGNILQLPKQAVLIIEGIFGLHPKFPISFWKCESLQGVDRPLVRCPSWQPVCHAREEIPPAAAHRPGCTHSGCGCSTCDAQVLIGGRWRADEHFPHLQQVQMSSLTPPCIMKFLPCGQWWVQMSRMQRVRMQPCNFANRSWPTI